MSNAALERYDWTHDEVRAIYDLPLFALIDRARDVFRSTQDVSQVQLCSLLSIKTGGCPEDCGYCAQSSRHNTTLEKGRLLDVEDVLQRAKAAKANGATRFCMGAAWRGVKDGPVFDQVLEMVRQVKSLGIETCTSLGMVNADQARQLKEAGLDSYNHNVDTSPAYYSSIITTRTFDQRMETLRNIQEAGIRVCTGGIIGMGESADDRCGMLLELARMRPHPDSIPINALIPIDGTPLEKLPPVTAVELVRMVATARILFPRSVVRLSAGRTLLAKEAQMLALYAGANSIFYGDKLLTAPNTAPNDDDLLLQAAGLRPLAPAMS